MPARGSDWLVRYYQSLLIGRNDLNDCNLNNDDDLKNDDLSGTISKSDLKKVICKIHRRSA
jgi:hypothetical protein